MKNLDKLLSDLNFTQYEAQCLNAIIQYNVLDASIMSEKSQVPKPKIYETMTKLKKRGFVDIIREGRKKIFRVKPKELIQERLLEYTRRIQTISNQAKDLIDEKYGTKEATEVPFIGIAGLNPIQDYINSLIDTAKKSVNCFLSKSHLNENIIRTMNRRANEIDIKIIFQNMQDIEYLQKKTSNIELYQLKIPAFDIARVLVNNLFNKDSMKQIISNGLIPSDMKDLSNIKGSYGIQIFNKIADNLEEIFGIMLIDENTSFFKVPVPVPTPMAIVSTLPEIVEFHSNGLESILNVSNLVE